FFCPKSEYRENRLAVGSLLIFCQRNLALVALGVLNEDRGWTGVQARFATQRYRSFHCIFHRVVTPCTICAFPPAQNLVVTILFVLKILQVFGQSRQPLRVAC